MMIVSVIIAVLAALALGLMTVFGRLQRELAKSRDWAETEFVALSLSRLIDPAEQQYLRSRVTPQEFRNLQRKRMRLAWRYAKRLRVDTAALARTDLASAPSIMVELNEINVALLKVQLVALTAYCWPNYELAADCFSEQWRRFTDRIPQPKVGNESSSRQAL